MKNRTSITRRTFLAGGSAASPCLMQRGANAQTALPDKGLEILVGFAPGGGADVIARLIAPQLERRLGRRVSVENRPGGTGSLPGKLLTIGPRDGSVVALIASTTLSSRFVVKDFPFDPIDDIEPITIAGTAQSTLAVSLQTGVRTFAEYLEWLKQGGGHRRKIGETSCAAFVEVLAKVVNQQTGATMTVVPYRGALAMVNDLQDGRLAACVTAITSLLEHRRGGRIRLILSSGQSRSAVAPDLPVAAELGFPALAADEWYGFFASSAVPAPLVAEWHRHIVGVLNDPQVKAELTQLGLEVTAVAPDEARKRVASYLLDWKQRLEQAGITPTN